MTRIERMKHCSVCPCFAVYRICWISWCFRWKKTRLKWIGWSPYNKWFSPWTNLWWGVLKFSFGKLMKIKNMTERGSLERVWYDIMMLLRFCKRISVETSTLTSNKMIKLRTKSWQGRFFILCPNKQFVNMNLSQAMQQFLVSSIPEAHNTNRISETSTYRCTFNHEWLFYARVV